MDRPARPSTVLRVLFPILVAACGTQRREVGIRHVLLVSLDTLRADHLGCYGAEQVATPHIDALAADGVRFTDVTTAAPTTLTAHTSIMTGTWPHTHGVSRNGFEVSGENVTLAEHLRQRGFHTAGVIGSFVLQNRFGLDQGFQHYDESFGDERTRNERSAEEVTAVALRHLDDVRDEVERIFLFVHYFDAHTPYSPPAEWRSGSGSGDLEDIERVVRAHQTALVGTEFGHTGVTINGFRGPLRDLVGKRVQEPGRLDRELAGLYAGEVAYLDHAIGQLIEGLKERGLYDQTLILLTADHGETFWEHHDLWNHGLWVYQTTVQVPLVVHLPGGEWGGTTVDAGVSSIDILPTLCELLGVDPPAPCEGISLVPMMRGQDLAHGPVFSEATQPWAVDSREGWRNLRKPACVRRGPWKYVSSPYNRLEQLFHLGHDPLERTDLMLGPLTPEAGAVLEELRAELQAWREASRPLASQLAAGQRPDTRRRLEELGYAGDDEAGTDGDDTEGDGRRR